MGTEVLGNTRRLARVGAAALTMMIAAAQPAFAESAYCEQLRAQIARAGGSAQRYRAMAAKQRVEYARLSARARAMQCDREQFLFFGDAPPPQCAPINARLRSLYDTITSYEQHGGMDDAGEREALRARYDAECRNVVAARAPRPHNFFEELFGVAPPDETTGLREVPLGPGDQELRDGGAEELTFDNERPAGGSMAICVRSCDGGFFPVSYSARSSNLSDLETLCKALCPNTEVTLYTRSPWKELEAAVSINGESYKDHPNALKFQKSYDPACGCKPPNQSWAEALADAERILAERHKKDQMVTAEEAEKLSRPYEPNDPRLKKQKGAKPDAAATPEEKTPAVDTPALKPSMADGPGETKETFRDVVGPDGVKRRVRVVAPTL